MQLGVWGSAVSSPVGSGASRHGIWCIFKAKIIALGVTFLWGLLRRKLNIVQKLSKDRLEKRNNKKKHDKEFAKKTIIQQEKFKCFTE